jgi:hypothetical protein
MVSAFCRFFFFFPFFCADMLISIIPDVCIVGANNFKVLVYTPILLLFWIPVFLVTILFCSLTSSKT